MANHENQSYVNEVVDGGAGVHGREAATTEIEDRGLFDHFSSKKNEDNIKLPHHQHNDEEKKKHGFLEKLHRSNSNSSSSSDEEEADEEKRKKKEKNGLKEKITGEDQKGIFEKIKEKLPGGGQDEHEDPLTYSSQHEKLEETNENKGIFEKIKEKLPGHHHEAHDSR